LVCMSRVGWNPSWFPDYRDYGNLSTGIWSLRWLFLYLRSYNLVGSVTPDVDFFWIFRSHLHPGWISTHGRISLQLFGRLLGEFPCCYFILIYNTPRIRLVKLTTQLKQSSTICLKKSEKSTKSWKISGINLSVQIHKYFKTKIKSN